MTKTKFGLGKGLGALIPSAPEREEEKVSVHPTPETKDDGVTTNVLAHIEVTRISPNPYQPRTEFDLQALMELAQSIQENGLVQPITVRRLADSYQLISGERRVRACREAGVTHIPAYIRQVETVEEMIELALIENIQRETLNPIEIAQSYQRLVDECRHTHDQIAQKVGKNRTTVVNFIRLLKLPTEIQDSIQKQEISMGHARALINIPDEHAQMRIWKKALREQLSVRKVEELARHVFETPKPPKQKIKPAPAQSLELEEIISRLRPIYGTKVNINATKEGKGTISFEFYSHEDFDRILDLLLSKAPE